MSTHKTAAKHTDHAESPPTEETLTPTRTQLEIPIRTFVKVAVFIVVLLAIYRLWPLISVVIMAVLLAGAVKPGADRLQKHMPRWAALLVIIFIFIAALVGLFSLIIPTLGKQIMDLGKNLPSLKENMLKHLPQDATIQEGAGQFISNFTQTDNLSTITAPLLSTGGMLLGGVGEMLLVVVIAFYIVADHGNILKWFLAFFKPETRTKWEETVSELSDVIFSYVTGQAIISACVMIFTFTVLTLLKVPGASMLALLAALLDVLPVLGFIISGVPALLLALSVSLPTALTVLGLYVAYHGIENYLLLPRVYEKNLQVSALGILLGMLAGSLVAGIPGAIAALPIVAAYPFIERVWLADYLGQRVIKKHEAQKEAQFKK